MSIHHKAYDTRVKLSCAISICLLRVKFDISRAALARYLGVRVRQLKRYETAREKPSAEVVCKLAGYFGEKLDFFFELTEFDDPFALFQR